MCLLVSTQSCAQHNTRGGILGCDTIQRPESVHACTLSFLKVVGWPVASPRSYYEDIRTITKFCSPTLSLSIHSL